MPPIEYTVSSPYASTPQSSWAIGPLSFRSIPSDGGDGTMTLTLRYQYRPDLLSFDLYKTQNYWWVFSVRNPSLRRDPVWAFVAGTTLIVPSLDHVRRMLG